MRFHIALHLPLVSVLLHDEYGQCSTAMSNSTFISHLLGGCGLSVLFILSVLMFHNTPPNNVVFCFIGLLTLEAYQCIMAFLYVEKLVCQATFMNELC